MSRQLAIKLAVAALFVALAGFGYWKFGDFLTFDYLATQEEWLRQQQSEHPILTYVVACVVYVSVTGLSIPGATVLTLVYAWYFGLLKGVVLVSFASTAGATVAFLVSRYLFRSTIETRFGERLEQFNESLEIEGPFYLFTLRLIPAVPFFVINVVMGLTPLKTLTYWWVSQLGMLPGTIVYVYAGSSVPSLKELAEQGTSGILSFNIIAAFVLLGTFPLLVRLLMKKFAFTNPESISDA